MGDWVIDTLKDPRIAKYGVDASIARASGDRSAESALVPTHGGPGCPCRGTRKAYQVHKTLDTASIKQLAKH